MKIDDDRKNVIWLKTTNIDERYGRYQYSKISDLIDDLKEILEKYGNGLICTDNEYTNETNQIAIVDDPNIGRMYYIGYDAKSEEE